MNQRSFLDGKVVLHPGDCREVLASLPEASVDAIVCDPPYGLEFMGKDWDSFTGAGMTKPGIGDRDTAWPSFTGTNKTRCRKCGHLVGQGGSKCKCEKPEPYNAAMPRLIGFQNFMFEVFSEAFRVLKPGGHLVAFSGTRTYHRMACAIEDAGFEIRDQIEYHHDSGGPYDQFVNSLNNEQRLAFMRVLGDAAFIGRLSWTYGAGFPKSLNASRALDGIRCMCGVRGCPAETASGAPVEVLQSDLHGGGEASVANAASVRGLQPGLDADDEVSSGPQQDMLAGMRSSGDLALKGGGDQEAAHILRRVRGRGPRSASIKTAKADQGVLQSELSSESGFGAEPRQVLAQGEERLDGREPCIVQGEGARRAEPGMEGRGDVPQAAGKLRQRALRAVPAGVYADGANGRLRDGAPAGDGAVGGSPADAAGVRASSGSQPAEQRPEQSGALAVQPDAQARGAWPACGRCGKPIVPDGLGTALKPATEPICLARKPLVGTVAQNVQQHGTGALNIDGCRIEGADEVVTFERHAGGRSRENYRTGTVASAKPSGQGRWPANILHDGSEEVLACFPDAPGQQRAVTGDERAHRTLNAYGDFGATRDGFEPRNDSGSAARFFYTSKADAEDRLGSKHPTVKPVDLMQWLVRLVAPKGGTVLDPFAGTGTTGEAAWREGMRAILIEREPEYQEDIARRMELAVQPTKRAAVAKTKNKLEKPEDMPLFGGGT